MLKKTILALLVFIFLFTCTTYAKNTKKDLLENIKKLDSLIKENPDVFISYYQRGICYYQAEDYQKALEDFEKSTSLNDRHSPSFNFLGLTHYRLGNKQKALENFNKAIELDPKDHTPYLNRGNYYLYEKMYEKALDDYSMAIKINPKDPIIYFYRGGLHTEKDEFENAIKDYTEAINLKSDIYPFYNNRGICLYLIGSFEKSINDFTKVIKFDPGCAPAYNNRGLAEQKTEEYNQAIQDFKKAIELDKNYILAYNNLGRAYLYLNQLDNAQKALDEGMSSNPPEELKPYFYWNMARLACRRQNQEIALEYIEKCIKQNPEWKELAIDNLDFKPLWRNKFFQELIGKIISAKFKYTILLVFNCENSALEKKLKEELISLRKDFGLEPEALGFKIYHISNDDEYSICCENLKIKTSQIPGIFLVELNELGGINKIIENWSADKLDEAWNELEILNYSLEFEPQSAEDYNNRGRAFQKIQDYSSAIKSFEKCIEMDPKFFMAYNNLGSVYIHMGEYKNAKKYLERGLSLAPPDGIKKYLYWNLARLAGKEENNAETLNKLKACVKIAPDLKNLIRNNPEFQNLWRVDEFKNLIQEPESVTKYKNTLLIVFNKENTPQEEKLKKELVYLRSKAGLSAELLGFKLFHTNKEEEYITCYESLNIKNSQIPGIFLVELNDFGGIKGILRRWPVKDIEDAWNNLLESIKIKQ